MHRDIHIPASVLRIDWPATTVAGRPFAGEKLLIRLLKALFKGILLACQALNGVYVLLLVR